MRRILLNRWLLAGVVTVVLYALFGFLLAPWLFSRYVGNFAAEKLKRKATITEVRINPFLFTLEGKGVTFQEADGRPIFGFERLFVDFELSSLFRWALTFADIRIEQPSLYAEIQRDGRLNLAALSDEFPESENPQPAGSRPTRLLVHHAEIVSGSFTFSDQSAATPATATFSPLNFEFKEISTLPERKGPYTVKADLPGGGSVNWQGEISLHPIFSQGELSMAGFKLATAWKFAQDELRLAEPAGEMDFSTRYRFDYQENTARLVLDDAKLALKGLSLTEKGKNTPLLTLEAIEAEGARFDLQARELVVPNIVVRNGSVAASVDEGGVLNWQNLIVHGETGDVSAPSPDASVPVSRSLIVRAGAVKVENVAVDYSDHSRIIPLALAVGQLNVLLNASAEVGSGPVKAVVDDLDVALNRVSFSEAGGDTPLLFLDTIFLNNGRIDIGNREITIALAGTTGGGTGVVRDKDGRIRLIEMLDPGDKGKIKREIVETGAKAQAEGKPWSFRLDSFEINGFNTSLQDHILVPAIVYDIKDIRVLLKNLTNDGKTPIDFETELNIAQGGSVSANGQFNQAGDQADARAKIIGVNLKPLGPAVGKFTFLALESGDVSAAVRVKYRSAKSGPQLSADGSVNLDHLMLNEADTGDRFLEWKKLVVNGLMFGLSPDRLHIDEVRLLEPGAKIVVFKDRSVNLARVVKPPDAANVESPQPREKMPAAAAGKDQKLFPVNIERVRVEKGVVDFADFSLVLPFATRVTDFNGKVTGISSDATSRTALKFEGKVDEYGHTTVEGGLSPFAPKTFTDIIVSFRNVEMKPLSPYSATFAGREIASGTLNLKLEYKIQNSELLGDNEVVLEQFTLGERVEVPDAINLPLDLAIALLTDAEGKIDVAVPVRGNVDNPKFSYGHVIRQAIVNLITKIVTAPFRALGGLLGDKGEQMDAIAFSPGSDRLLPPELKKIKKVVEALEKRPQLRLVVQGRFDPEVDSEALRTELVRRAIAEETGVKLAPNEEPGPIAFDNAKTQKALEKLLKHRSGDKAVADFEDQYEKKTGRKAERVKPYLAVLGVESSDTDFYQAVFEELVTLEPMPENDLQNLARRRAEAIVKEIEATAGFDTSRVGAGDPGPVEKVSKETVNTKLGLDVIKPSS